MNTETITRVVPVAWKVTDDDVASFLSVAHRHKVTRGLPKGVTRDDIRLAMQFAYNNKTMAIAAPPPPSTQADDSRRTFIIVNRPGLVPVRKGPCFDKRHTETMLRELYALHPDCTLTVIEMPTDCYPDSGIEWLDIHGDGRKKRVEQANVQQEDALLPCDVRVAPATTISAGVAVSTLLSCIELRRGSGVQHKFTRAIEQRDADARDAARWRKAMEMLDSDNGDMIASHSLNDGTGDEESFYDSVGVTQYIDAAIDRAQESGNG